MSRDAFCQGKANGKNSISDSGLFSIRAVKFDLLDLVDFGDMAVSLDTVKVVNIKSQITIKIKKKTIKILHIAINIVLKNIITPLKY